jgi:hypothetical protein
MDACLKYAPGGGVQKVALSRGTSSSTLFTTPNNQADSGIGKKWLVLAAEAHWKVYVMKLDERTIANMEVALETSFRDQPHGGDHESRKRVARKLLQSAKSGHRTLGALQVIANSALHELAVRKTG